jgi:hypothetical protein
LIIRFQRHFSPGWLPFCHSAIAASDAVSPVYLPAPHYAQRFLRLMLSPMLPPFLSLFFHAATIIFADMPFISCRCFRLFVSKTAIASRYASFSLFA